MGINENQPKENKQAGFFCFVLFFQSLFYSKGVNHSHMLFGRDSKAEGSFVVEKGEGFSEP